MELISNKIAEQMSGQVIKITKQATSQVSQRVEKVLALLETSLTSLSPVSAPEAPTRGKKPPSQKEKAPTGQQAKGKRKKK